MTTFIKTTESIFDIDVDAIVNPVNCVGVMGGGLAKQFRDRYPEMLCEYNRICYEKRLKPGGTYVFFDEKTDTHIINVATKNHWKNPSQYSYIVDGLFNINFEIRKYRIRSICIPKIGCGLGGLDWNIVYGHIRDIIYYENNDLTVYTYE